MITHSPEALAAETRLRDAMVTAITQVVEHDLLADGDQPLRNLVSTHAHALAAASVDAVADTLERALLGARGDYLDYVANFRRKDIELATGRVYTAYQVMATAIDELRGFETAQRPRIPAQARPPAADTDRPDRVSLWQVIDVDPDADINVLRDKLDQVAERAIDEANENWHTQMRQRTRIVELETRLASESSTRITAELGRQIGVHRADIARCDGKAGSLATLVSLIGAGVLAVATATGALQHLSLATGITGGLAALAALVTLGLAAAVIWPARRRGDDTIDPTTVASLTAGLYAERALVVFLAGRKFAFLRAALIALAVTVGLGLAAIATAIGA